jgi:hypothetical protein
MAEFLVSAAIFFGIIGAWAWRVERRGKRHRELIRAWFHEHVPPDDIPENLR